jgi:hypothetical protein
MKGLTKDREDTLLSAIAEADRYIRETATAEIDHDYVRQRLTEGLQQLDDDSLRKDRP